MAFASKAQLPLSGELDSCIINQSSLAVTCKGSARLFLTPAFVKRQQQKPNYFIFVPFVSISGLSNGDYLVTVRADISSNCVNDRRTEKTVLFSAVQAVSFQYPVLELANPVVYPCPVTDPQENFCVEVSVEQLPPHPSRSKVDHLTYQRSREELLLPPTSVVAVEGASVSAKKPPTFISRLVFLRQLTLECLALPSKK